MSAHKPPTSPVRWLAVIIGLIFAAEFMIMEAYRRLQLPTDGLWWHALDAMALVVVIGPVLYLLYVVPTRRLLDQQRDLLDELQLTSTVFDQAEEGILITDANARIERVNEAFTRITEFQLADVFGQTPGVLKSGRHDAEFYQQMWASLAERGHWAGEVWNRTRGGKVYPESLSITAVRDEGGSVSHYVGIFSRALYDGLTGLANRYLLQDRLRQALNDAERRREGIAVVFLDLDGFKEVNDEFGHDAGDQVLQAVARILRGSVRRNDIPARLGGDEFVLVLRAVSTDSDVLSVVEKIRGHFPITLAQSTEPLPVTVSIGYSTFPEDGSSAEELIRKADRAMYRAKRTGKNGYRRYTEGMALPSDAVPPATPPDPDPQP